MKPRYLVQLMLIIIIPLFSFKKDKCNSDAIYNDIVKKLKKFSVLKDYRIYSKKKKNISPEDYEYFTISLNRGVKYKFTALSSGDYEGKLVINLYNTPQKEFLFATSLIQGTENVRESIEFKCQSTGNFCVGYYFLGGKEGCGVAVSAFQQE